MIEIYRIKSCLQDYSYTSKGDWDELTELERLAEIGRATEKWFAEGHVMEYTGNEVYRVDDLLDWAKED